MYLCSTTKNNDRRHYNQGNNQLLLLISYFSFNLQVEIMWKVVGSEAFAWRKPPALITQMKKKIHFDMLNQKFTTFSGFERVSNERYVVKDCKPWQTWIASNIVHHTFGR